MLHYFATRLFRKFATVRYSHFSQRRREVGHPIFSLISRPHQTCTRKVKNQVVSTSYFGAGGVAARTYVVSRSSLRLTCSETRAIPPSSVGANATSFIWEGRFEVVDEGVSGIAPAFFPESLPGNGW